MAYDPESPWEAARARRRRDRDRMVKRGRRVAARNLDRPVRTVPPDAETARDLERRGLAADWGALSRLRDAYARRNADHLARCSCWMCGNPRRLGEKTLKERAAEAAATADLDDIVD
jgi:hypothetical protein